MAGVGVHNSLERLFDGLAASLREAVLPHLTDPYARSQVGAAIEILANLATRVEWRRDLVEGLVELVGEALAAAGLEPPAVSPDLAETHRRFLVALAQAAANGDPDEPIKQALLAHLEGELRLLRTGMYR
ncbi:MAG: hypothetical protein KatS3mg011_2381 [Acidimicrobiia bacterium]|nr:MAG: hypothetical protein KatS3mg011_2381 [Acidimicrobiia bacterium]